MENIYSTVEDVVYIAKELKNKLTHRISINEIGLYQEILHGKFLKGDNQFKFYVKCNKDHFLRLQMDPGDGTYSEQYDAMLELISYLMNIVFNGEKVGNPLAIYTVKNNGRNILSTEWCFTDKKEYFSSLASWDLFDDAEEVNIIAISRLYDDVTVRHEGECCGNCDWCFSSYDEENLISEVMMSNDGVYSDEDVTTHSGDCCLSVPEQERYKNGFWCKSYTPTESYKLELKNKRD